MSSLAGQAGRQTLRAFTRAYRELIANRIRQVPFWMLVGFLPTFVIARNLVAHDPNLFVTVRGVHVHHFTWGVMILAVVGFASLVSPKRAQPWLAVVYGVGLALAFDEFGMWLHLTSNYKLDQSEDVMVGILVFLVVVVYFLGLLRRALRIMYPRRRKGNQG
jgi:hypothetical protein